jgi:Na+/melibiose symporter-like transporter
MPKDLDPESDTEAEQTVPDVTDASSASTGKYSPFASLRIRNFRFLLTGNVLYQAGVWIQQVTVNWLVYSLTGSGTMLGSISLVRTLTAVGMIPVSGVLTDRVDRRKLMFISNAWSLIITLVLGLILLFGRSNILYSLSLPSWAD